jgi:hypothetical protein
MLLVLSSWIVLKGGLVFLEIALLLYEHVIKSGISAPEAIPSASAQIIPDRTCYPPGNSTATYCMTPIELHQQAVANPTLTAQALQQSRIQLKSESWEVNSCRSKQDRQDYTCITFLKSRQLISSTQSLAQAPSAQVLVSCIFPTPTNPRSQARKGIVTSGIFNNYSAQDNIVYLRDCRLEQIYTP